MYLKHAFPACYDFERYIDKKEGGSVYLAPLILIINDGWSFYMPNNLIIEKTPVYADLFRLNDNEREEGELELNSRVDNFIREFLAGQTESLYRLTYDITQGNNYSLNYDYADFFYGEEYPLRAALSVTVLQDEQGEIAAVAEDILPRLYSSMCEIDDFDAEPHFNVQGSLSFF